MLYKAYLMYRSQIMLDHVAQITINGVKVFFEKAQDGCYIFFEKNGEIITLKTPVFQSFVPFRKMIKVIEEIAV